MNVTEDQVIEAMKHWERIHIRDNGPLNGITLPKECSALANLLGAMWFHKEAQAEIPNTAEVARLIKEAL